MKSTVVSPFGSATARHAAGAASAIAQANRRLDWLSCLSPLRPPYIALHCHFHEQGSDFALRLILASHDGAERARPSISRMCLDSRLCATNSEKEETKIAGRMFIRAN
jgi:hypothetical protein